MATATRKQTTTFATLSCPFCGTTDENTLNMDLMDLSRIVCGGCDEEFSPAEALAKATATMEMWAKVVRWVALAETA